MAAAACRARLAQRALPGRHKLEQVVLAAVRLARTRVVHSSTSLLAARAAHVVRARLVLLRLALAVAARPAQRALRERRLPVAVARAQHARTRAVRSSTTPVAVRVVHAQRVQRAQLRLDRAVAAQPAQRVLLGQRKRGRAALAAAPDAQTPAATFSITPADARARRALAARLGTNRPALDVAVSKSIVAPDTTYRARRATPVRVRLA